RLQKIKGMLDHDKEYCYLTMAFRPIRHSPAEIASAYQETTEMNRWRTLNRDTQIITDLRPETHSFWLSTTQDQELLAALQAGEEEKALEQIRRFLLHMKHNKATAQQFSEFGKDVVAKVVKALLAHNLDISFLLDGYSPYRR